VSAHGALRAAQRTPVGRISLYIACRRVVPTLCGVVRCVDNTGCPRRSAPSRRTTTRRTTQTGSATPRRWPVARRRSKRRYVRPHLRRDSPTSAPGLTSLAIQLHTEMKFRAAEFEKYKFGAGVRGPHLPQDCAPSSTGPVAEHRVPLSFWYPRPTVRAFARSGFTRKEAARVRRQSAHGTTRRESFAR
jgi:hypothetical protein